MGNKYFKRETYEPTEGENYLCELLDKYLPQDFEIYIQPIIKGNRPDIVLLNQKYGVFIIEVKDWKLERFYKIKDDKGNEHFHKNGEPDIEIGSPLEQVMRYHRRLAMYADIDPTKISYCFYFYNSTTKSARNFVCDDPFTFGYDKDIDFVKSFSKYTIKDLQKDELDRLRELLQPSLHKREDGIETKLNVQQQNLVGHKPNTWQRARGVAGSGKTFVIAQRAANIASKGLSVLVVCFNKTLKNYIKWQIHNAYLDFDWDYIDIFHFHGFIKEFVAENGGKIWGGGDFDYWESQILSQANKILDSDGGNCKQRRYDAILIDEAQDFEKEWFDLLIKFLSDNNEILLVADGKQNVYEKKLSWVNDSMEGLGYKFKGQWGNLKTSIRQKYLPDIILKANEFSNLFLKEYLEKNPDKALGFILDLTTDQKEQLIGFAPLYWKDIFKPNKETLNNEIYKAYEYLLKNGFNDKNIVILLPSVKIGNEVVNFFENKEIEIEHTFEKNSEKRDKNKEKFSLQSDKLKISTIESFKGLEIDAVIYVSDEQDNIKKDIETYIAITRAQSHLIVLNQTEKYQAYGAKWKQLDEELKG